MQQITGNVDSGTKMQEETSLSIYILNIDNFYRAICLRNAIAITRASLF